MLCEVFCNLWDEYPSKRDSNMWACSIKFIKMFENDTNQSNSDVLVYNVKFDQIFENNTHSSNCDVWACCVKVVDMVENKIHMNDSGVYTCSVKFVKWLKILLISVRLTCERDLWISSQCLRVIAICAILMCKWLCAICQPVWVKYPFENLGRANTVCEFCRHN